MEGEDRDIQELLTALELAFVARSQDEDTGSDESSWSAKAANS